MITLFASGRLADHPKLTLTSRGEVCNFRLLDNRWNGQEEVIEAVDFATYGPLAAAFCSTAEKGQELTCTGTQRTKRIVGQDGQKREYVSYQLTAFELGRKSSKQASARPVQPGRLSGPNAAGHKPAEHTPDAKAQAAKAPSGLW